METVQQAIEYAANPVHGFWPAVVTHLELCLIALLIGSVIGIPVGIIVSRYNLLARVSVNVMGVLRVIPSLALLFIFIPLLHTGFTPAATALTILAIPPLLINTEAGMRGVDRAVIEAGRGMGMNSVAIALEGADTTGAAGHAGRGSHRHRGSDSERYPGRYYRGGRAWRLYYIRAVAGEGLYSAGGRGAGCASRAAGRDRPLLYSACSRAPPARGLAQSVGAPTRGAPTDFTYSPNDS